MDNNTAIIISLGLLVILIIGGGFVMSIKDSQEHSFKEESNVFFFYIDKDNVSNHLIIEGSYVVFESDSGWLFLFEDDLGLGIYLVSKNNFDLLEIKKNEMIFTSKQEQT